MVRCSSSLSAVPPVRLLITSPLPPAPVQTFPRDDIGEAEQDVSAAAQEACNIVHSCREAWWLSGRGGEVGWWGDGGGGGNDTSGALLRKSVVSKCEGD